MEVNFTIAYFQPSDGAQTVLKLVIVVDTSLYELVLDIM